MIRFQTFAFNFNMRRYNKGNLALVGNKTLKRPVRAGPLHPKP
jgi:hypothetical protein